MIELGKQQDIGEILNSINEAKKEMENDHNPQWSEDDYPNFKIPSDIEKENLSETIFTKLFNCWEFKIFVLSLLLFPFLLTVMVIIIALLTVKKA